MGETSEELSSAEARRQLYDIMRQDIEIRDKAIQVLKLGKQYLDVENGHLTRIDPEANYWAVIESTAPVDFPAGLTADFSTTYCRNLLQQEDFLAVHDAPNQGLADDPAFEEHGLHTYCGAAIEVDDEFYGTVCFVSEAPRGTPFTDEETMFVELIAHLLGHTIEEEQFEAELTERNEMVNVLSRVLRHDLRNKMGIIRGYTAGLQEQSPEKVAEAVETILEAVDDLVHLGDKTRRLSELVGEPFDRRELDLESLVQYLADEIQDEYPDADVTVEGAAMTGLRAAPQLETALRELIENAVKHGGSEVSVTVSLSASERDVRIQVLDNGPGMPEQERVVVESGNTTPLQHGSGLGLWLAYWIVTRHDGHIETAVSETGTTVTITLPYRSPKAFPDVTLPRETDT